MYTEELKLSDFVITVEEKSKFSPDKTVTREVGIACPRCKEQLPMLEYMKPYKCSKCYLEMFFQGNVLTVYEG
jgi:ribosomal protein S27AE